MAEQFNIQIEKIYYTPRTFMLWQGVIETYQRNIRRIGKKNGIKSKKENLE